MDFDEEKNSPYKCNSSEVHNIWKSFPWCLHFSIGMIQNIHTYIINRDSVCIIPIIDDLTGNSY